MHPAPRPLSPDFLQALGRFLYALTRLDGRLQSEEVQATRRWLAAERHQSVALHELLGEPDFDQSLFDAYQAGLRYFDERARELDYPTRRWLLLLLTGVADAHAGISPEEARFLAQFRQDLNRLPTATRAQGSRHSLVQTIA